MPSEKIEADVGRTIRPIRLVQNPEIRRIERPGSARERRDVERREPVVNRVEG